MRVRYRTASSASGNYIGFGFRIETVGTERTTIIVNIFDIMQTIRNTGIHLKVDEEQWRIAQESKRQKLVGMIPMCATCRGYGSQILLMHSKKPHVPHV